MQTTHEMPLIRRRELEDVHASPGLANLHKARIAREENKILLDIVRRAVLPNKVQQLIVAADGSDGGRKSWR